MRSGTTFLAGFLDQQERTTFLADVPVSLFFEAHKLGVTDIDAPLSLRERRVLLNNLWQEGRYRRIPFSEITEDQAGTWFELFTRALEVIGHDGDRVVGIKRTRERELVEQLLGKGVKVLYIVRDPRDVLLSARDRFGEYDLFRFVDSWLASVRLAQRWQAHPGFHWLRFEDLVLRRNGVLEALGSFLGIEILADIGGREVEPGLGGSSSFGDVCKPFDPAAVERWRQKLDTPEVQLASRRLADEIARLGYPEHRSQQGREADRLMRAYRRYRLGQRLRSLARRVFP